MASLPISQAGFRPEAELLLCAASVAEESKRLERIGQLLQEDLSWDYLFNLALENRLISLLYWHFDAARLNANHARTVPSATLLQFRNYFFQEGAHNLLLTGEMIELLRVFRRQFIPVIPLKGPVVAASLYRNLALRHFWDLDILIYKSDFSRVKRLLLSRGYRPEIELSDEQEEGLLENNYHYPFEREDGRVHLEVHWQVLPSHQSLHFDASYLWDNAIDGELSGQETLVLPPEVLLIMLGLHGGGKHQWSRLKWIADIARLITNFPEMNWKRVIEDMERFESERSVLVGLCLARDLLGAVPDKKIEERIASNSLIQGLSALVPGRLFREDGGLPGFCEWRSYVKTRENGNGSNGHSQWRRLPEWIRYLRVVMAPEWADRQSYPLPAHFSFLHYLLRPVRLIGKHRAEILARLR